MKAFRPYRSDPTKILTRRELRAVLADLERKAKRSAGTRLNRIVFRLAACCGLRASEITQLQVGDVRPERPRPHVRIRAGAAKGGHARVVPHWWDDGTLENFAAWKAMRVQAGAAVDAPFVAVPRTGRAFSRHTLRKRFRTACKVPGRERLATLTIHHGRHTFLSHALAGGRTLAEVRDAAGHTNISVTSAYLRIVLEDEPDVGRLFI